MLPIPEIDRASTAFGETKHMPKYEDIPERFRKFHGDPYVNAVSHWFFNGASAHAGGIKINGVKFTARPDVHPGKALAAIKSILSSFEPSHEHKEAACAYLLHEWFEIEQQKKSA